MPLASAAIPFLPLLLVHVPRFAADVSFIDFHCRMIGVNSPCRMIVIGDNSPQLTEAGKNGLKRLPDSVMGNEALSTVES
jgi:hypothetical protein